VYHPFDKRKPRVVITPPASELLWGLVPIEVTATDDDTVVWVELKADGEPIGEALAVPATFLIDAATYEERKHRFVARARDLVGRTGKSRRLVVSTTAGHGLLTQKVVLNQRPQPNDDRVTLQATLALDVLPPNPKAPLLGAVRLDLSDGLGTLLSVTVPAGELTLRSGDTVGKAVVAATGQITSLATLRLSVARGNTYKFKLDGKFLALPRLPETVFLEIEVGGEVRSQTLLLKRNAVGNMVLA
jgi:hypothetical protein